MSNTERQAGKGECKSRCFDPDCNKTPHFEDWAGWRWCFKHWWCDLKYQDQKWFYFRTTKII